MPPPLMAESKKLCTLGTAYLNRKSEKKTFGEISPGMSTGMYNPLKYVADRHERRFASLAGVSLRGKGGRFLWDLKRRLTLLSIRGWARLRLARARQIVGLCSRPDLTPDVPQYDPCALLASADGLHEALVSATHPSMFW